MDTPTTRSAWRTVLIEQGRTLAWLADRTGKSRRTVYAYSRGELVPTPAWLTAASVVLGVDVTERAT
jgi:predicted transcriptional regulator